MTTTVMISRMPRPASDCWNAWAVPWKLVVMEMGSIEAARLCTSLTAWPSATPGARSNEMVTEGSWPVWLTVSGPTPVVNFETAPSGTSWPDEERM